MLKNVPVSTETTGGKTMTDTQPYDQGAQEHRSNAATVDHWMLHVNRGQTSTTTMNTSQRIDEHDR